VSGFGDGEPVEVWFEGGGHTSESFTFEAVTTIPNEVLILAAEDYSGPANFPTYASSGAPNYLEYYTDALDDRDTSYDIYDVDAMGRVAPDQLGVLSHYDAVIWYTGNDYLTREPGQVPGTGASTLANSEILEVRSYLNEGGKLLYTGRHAGWQYAFAYPYNPVSTPPYCDETLRRKQAITVCCSRTTSSSTNSGRTCSRGCGTGAGALAVDGLGLLRDRLDAERRHECEIPTPNPVRGTRSRS
jgi:hypothetical protein